MTPLPAVKNLYLLPAAVEEYNAISPAPLSPRDLRLFLVGKVPEPIILHGRARQVVQIRVGWLSFKLRPRKGLGRGAYCLIACEVDTGE